MLVKYVYDKSVRNVIDGPVFLFDGTQTWVRIDKGRPIGVVVALSANKIGWSRCDDRDEFNKKVGKNIAMQRAESSEVGIIPRKILEEYEWMKVHAERYFMDNRHHTEV